MVMQAPRITPRRRTIGGGRSLLVLGALGALVSVLLAGCAGTSTGMQPGPTSSASAPAPLMMRDGVGSFGLYTGNGPIIALDPKNGNLLWRRNPLPPGARMVSPLLQPTVQEGLVYAPSSYRDSSSSIYHAALEALDPATGQLRWRHEVTPQHDASPGVDSGPVVANGVVYLTSHISTSGQTPTRMSLLEALDSRSGALRWSKTLKEFSSAPVIADEQVILREDQELVALKSSDGSMMWRFALPGDSFHDLDSGVPPIAPYLVADGYPGPLVAQRLVFVEATEADGNGGGIGTTWFAVKTSDGSLAWRTARSASGAVFTRPVLNQGGSVLCTSAHWRDSGDVVMGLSTADGRTLWTKATAAKASACAAAGDIFYLTETTQDTTAGGMLALSSHTGQQVWRTSITAPTTVSGAAAPPQRDGLAALLLPGPIPTPTGAIPVLDSIAIVQLETGKILWRQDFPALREIAVTIGGDQVVVPQYGGAASARAPMVVAYTLRTGSETWAYTFGRV
jgi:outer membrane protein assembly factor BamB